MISLNQRRNIFYHRQPKNITWNVHLFVTVTGIDMSGLLRNWKSTTPRVVANNLKTWSSHTSCLMNTITGSQEQLTHQQMELHFLSRSRKIIMTKMMTIGKRSAICNKCDKKGHIRPNCLNKNRSKYDD